MPPDDPREQIAKLAGGSPILLFPLRLETRFKTGAAGTPQLWVRVYPDSCLIDTFEPTLTEREVDSAKAFWERHAAAAGDEALERAAWREIVSAHGAGRAGWIIRRPLENIATRPTSWSSAARIELLPERFVFVGYPRDGAPLTALGGVIKSPLAASPDPNASEGDALRQFDDELRIPNDIAWMFDFQKAVDAGMALRIDLTPAQARDGFERIVVLGVRFADSPEQGSSNLATLLEHHLHSRSGLEILPQGTPTNNTEKSGAGYTFRDDPDASFDVQVREREQYAIETDPLLRRDGQWLADLVGLPHQLVQRIPNAGGGDQSDARAMQIALWPGTLGYMMQTQLAPVFSDEDVDWTRAFFTRYVTGRGPLPALRIGRQPYGILPATNFRALAWTNAPDASPAAGASPRLQRLHGILKKVGDDWDALVDRLSHIGKQGGDPHQMLLDVLGLHSTSAEYYPLHAESTAHKFHEISFFDFNVALQLLDRVPAILPMTLLRGFGYTGADIPDLFDKIFKARQTPLTGPLIDDRPLSETATIRDYAGDQNYVEWLAAAARTSIQAVQQEQGFDAGKKPAALLYLLLRHAIQLGFYDTVVRMQVTTGVLEGAAVASARREPAFVHVSDAHNGAASESRYDTLFRADPRVTNGSDLRVGDYIARNIQVVSPYLREQTEALDRLAPLSTAKLERLFAEHIDCCTYRLDAWKQGLLAQRLESLNHKSLHLGAFGWVEHLRPKPATTTPANLPAGLATPVNRRDTAPLVRDSANGGLIHAPSINHATTAAVLRNGYLANDGRLAVNVTSRRVRLALDVIDGMRNGQSLGALLGYRFERHIHDNGPVGVRDLVYHLRRAFPLAANQIAGTATESGGARQSIAAMNVVDGRKLIEHVEGTTPPNIAYPFGVSTLPRRAAPDEQAITAALAHIRDVNDAIADLVLTEGVHQAVLGNYERSAGTLDAFAKGNHPPEPDVIRTPRTGIGLTLRTAIHLSPAPASNPLPGIPLTPLASAEPAVNAWLRDMLPKPDDVGCNVSFTDRASGTEQSIFLNQRQLELQPIDLVYRVQTSAEQALGDVDDLILRHLHAHHAPRHDRPITIRHSVRVPDKYNWFELQALLRSLRVLCASRPLRPADLMRGNDATSDQQATVSLPRARVQAPRDALRDTLLPTLAALAATLDDAAVSIDAAIAAFAATLAPFSAYRLPQSGAGFAYEWRANAYSALAGRVHERVDMWNARLAEFDARLADYDARVTELSDPEKFALLGGAELLVSAQLTNPQPASAADYRDTVLPPRRGAFVAKRDSLAELYTGARATLAQLLVDASGALPLTAFDVKPLAFADAAAEVQRVRAHLIVMVAALQMDVERRIERVDALLTEHDAASGGEQKAALLQEAGKVVFGEDFQFVPHITLPAPAVAEMTAAWQHSTSGNLTEHLTVVRGRDFPVDDWVHGVARVRDKMRHWENVVLLGDAALLRAPELTPLQLPFGVDEPWLALEFPDDHEITSDRLLYTAHFVEPWAATQPLCGLLVDEWTEVIPGKQETTGVAFHYDRPNSEPPQAWLLALPAAQSGAWSWDDLLGAVNDTLDSAKLRAIEPAHIDATAYSWFLPATMSSHTFPEISISNNLLRNRKIFGEGTA